MYVGAAGLGVYLFIYLFIICVCTAKKPKTKIKLYFAEDWTELPSKMISQLISAWIKVGIES